MKKHNWGEATIFSLDWSLTHPDILYFWISDNTCMYLVLVYSGIRDMLQVVSNQKELKDICSIHKWRTNHMNIQHVKFGVTK